ncbi:MAG: hypothetical protein AAGF71_06895 [Pseudomonadota bacterium]
MWNRKRGRDLGEYSKIFDTDFWTALAGLGAFGALILALATAGLAYFSGYQLKHKLEDRNSWDALLKAYRPKSQTGYFTGVERVLSFAQWFYGPKALSFNAFARCLQLAYAYPLLAALIGWVLFNTTTLGGMEVFEPIDRGFERAWRAGVVVMGCAVLVCVMLQIDNIEQFFVDVANRGIDWSSTRTGLWAQSVRVLSRVLRAVAGAVAVAFAVAFAGAVAFAVAVAVAVAVAFAGAVAGAVAVAFAFAVAVAFAFAVAVAVVFGETEFAALWAFWLLLLPFLNALADMVSLAITRGFLTRMLAQKDRFGFGRILVQVVLDLFLAFACLTALLVSLGVALEFWAWASPTTIPFDWRLYLRTVWDDPTHGTAIYMIIATTLIPTIVHLTAGLCGAYTRPALNLQPAVARLERAHAEAPDFPDGHTEDQLNVYLSRADRHDIVRDVRRWRLWSGLMQILIALAVVFVVVQLWLVTQVFIANLPPIEHLIDQLTRDG